MVELIHLRLCESSTDHFEGATVCAIASGVNFILKVGKFFIINVVRYRSSPSEKRFFLCSVSTLGSAYSSMTTEEMITGRPPSAVRMR